VAELVVRAEPVQERVHLVPVDRVQAVKELLPAQAQQQAWLRAQRPVQLAVGPVAVLPRLQGPAVVDLRHNQLQVA